MGQSSITDRSIRFSHAGNAGDIIFSLPALRAISGDQPAEYFLEVDAPAFYAEGLHPLGNLRLNVSLAQMMLPLLQAQPFIKKASIIGDDQVVDYRLDLFRDAPLPGDKGYLARWYFYTFGVNWDLSQPWLYAERDAGLADTIVLARSQRYRNPALDHRFLARYPRVVFVGVDVEFEEMRRLLPRLQHLKIPDFKVMATVINSGRLFIGNQSLPYSIAEALKVRRILEACHRTPTNVPEGANGHDVYFQRPFEFLVRQWMDDIG